MISETIVNVVLVVVAVVIASAAFVIFVLVVTAAILVVVSVIVLILFFFCQVTIFRSLVIISLILLSLSPSLELLFTTNKSCERIF